MQKDIIHKGTRQVHDRSEPDLIRRVDRRHKPAAHGARHIGVAVASARV